MQTIRWDRKLKCFVLADGTHSTEGHGGLGVETAFDVSLSSLRRALAGQAGVPVPPLGSLPAPDAYSDWSEYSEAVLAGPNSEIYFESGETPFDAIFFCITEHGHLRTHFAVEHAVSTDRNTVVEITRRIFSRPYDVIQLLYDQNDPEDGLVWSYQLACDPIGRTVGSIWQGYKTLCFMLTTSPEDLVKSAEGVQRALRLGRPDVLIGTSESSWLEAKSRDYLLSSATKKIELALDVARFANADGGLLVLGLRTSRVNGVDTISRVSPLPMPARQAARYRRIIDDHLYPFANGLDVFTVPYDQGELLVISIPAQSQDDKPFLVQGDLGSITDGKLKGRFVSIVQRRGADAEYLTRSSVQRFRPWVAEAS
jgi:hypothetical protein